MKKSFFCSFICLVALFCYTGSANAAVCAGDCPDFENKSATTDNPSDANNGYGITSGLSEGETEAEYDTGDPYDDPPIDCSECPTQTYCNETCCDECPPSPKVTVTDTGICQANEISNDAGDITVECKPKECNKDNFPELGKECTVGDYDAGERCSGKGTYQCRPDNSGLECKITAYNREETEVCGDGI